MNQKSIKVIPSKSQLHRALICSFLAGKPLAVNSDVVSKDIEATIGCIEKLSLMTKPSGCERVLLDCNESGSTYRFLLPVLGALGISSEIILRGKLKERPMEEYMAALRKQGMSFEEISEGIKATGQLRSGEFQIPGNISSQYISGLLFALPILKGDSIIKLTTSLKSKPYVDMTIEMLKEFAIEIIEIKEENNPQGETIAYKVNGNQRYMPKENVEIEGDWSNGGFLLVAEAMSREGVLFENLRLDSTQGDKMIIKVLENFGFSYLLKNSQEKGRGFLGLKADLDCSEADCKVGSQPLKKGKIVVDGDHIPDLVPAIMALASANEGLTEITNCQRLKFKESDRVQATVELINNLGGKAWYDEGSIFVLGKNSLEGGFCCSYNDHRIVMMAALCSLISKNNVFIDSSEAVDKSFRGFMDVMKRNFTGVKLYTIDEK